MIFPRAGPRRRGSGSRASPQDSSGHGVRSASVAGLRTSVLGAVVRGPGSKQGWDAKHQELAGGTAQRSQGKQAAMGRA